MRHSLVIAPFVMLITLGVTGCHRRVVEGRAQPPPEAVEVGTTTTTGAEVSADAGAEPSKEAWGPLPPSPLSAPLVSEQPAAASSTPETTPSAPPPPSPLSPPTAAPTEQPIRANEEEPARRVGPPSAADRNTWAGSVAQ